MGRHSEAVEARIVGEPDGVNTSPARGNMSSIVAFQAGAFAARRYLRPENGTVPGDDSAAIPVAVGQVTMPHTAEINLSAAAAYPRRV